LYVGNLAYGVTDSDLQTMFAAHGTVQSAQVIMDRDTGQSKGFGFVEMGSDKEAAAAITALNGQQSGGRALNVVPDACRVSLDRRVVDGEDPAAVAAAIADLARAASPLPVEVETLLALPAFLERPDAPFVQRLAAWSGEQPRTVTYGTNAIEYGGLASSCVVLGPGSIAQAHGDVEWVEIAELERLAAIYASWWELDG